MQKAQGEVLAKAVFTSGANTYTYGQETTDILLKVTHPEQPWSQKAQVLVENYSNNLTSLSLEGYQGVLSYGYRTSAGDEYSATAPLKIKGQELINSNGRLSCLFDLYGIPDQLADDHASEPFSMESSDTRTVKTLISAVLGGTLAPFSHCTAITVTYDSEDSLIDTFKPADYFRISIGKTRLACLKELLSYTKCVARAEADGAIHISSPTVSGSTYAYEYNDDFAATSHGFYSKIYRNRLVLPNKITVKSSNEHEPQYTGSATDATSFALLPKQDFIPMRLASDAQATAIAEAMIQKLQVESEKGNGFAPMNVGQEVHDYIKITDSVENDNRTGNIGYLTRYYEAGRFNFGFGFGDILLSGVAGIMIPSGSGATAAPSYVTYSDLYAMWDILNGNMKQITDYLTAMEDNAVFKKLTVTDSLIIPSEAA